jgi:hypothetical protein
VVLYYIACFREACGEIICGQHRREGSGEVKSSSRIRVKSDVGPRGWVRACAYAYMCMGGGGLLYDELAHDYSHCQVWSRASQCLGVLSHALVHCT